MAQSTSSTGTLPQPPATRSGNSLMASSLIGAHGLEHMYAHGFLALIPAIYDALGLVPIQASLLTAVRQLSSGLTSVFGGFVVDMFQERRGPILAFSMLLISLGFFLVATLPVYGLILAALVVASAGSALWHPPALGLLAQRFPERRGLFISLHRSAGNVGRYRCADSGGVAVGILQLAMDCRRRHAGYAVPGVYDSGVPMECGGHPRSGGGHRGSGFRWRNSVRNGPRPQQLRHYYQGTIAISVGQPARCHAGRRVLRHHAHLPGFGRARHGRPDGAVGAAVVSYPVGGRWRPGSQLLVHGRTLRFADRSRHRRRAVGSARCRTASGASR